MATQRDIDMVLAEVRGLADQLDPTGMTGRSLHVERTVTISGLQATWNLTMRGIDQSPGEHGHKVVELGTTKGEVLRALQMVGEGMLLAIMAAAVDVKRKEGIL